MNSFVTEFMSNEFERLHNNIPIDGISMKRYELPPPPPGKLTEVAAWTESIDNSMAQLEHQHVRLMNLELMSDFSKEMWQTYLEMLTSLQAKAQTRLDDLRREIQEVNWERKTKQQSAGEKLKTLEVQWVMLVSKNYEIEQECVKLCNMIENLKIKLTQSEKKINNEPVDEDNN